MSKLYRRGKCDFPWSYNSRAVHAESRFGGGASGTYGLISDEEAIDLWAPWIGSLFDHKNAVCFFWIVWPKVEFCLEFIRACGFDISTLAFDWVKTCKDDPTRFKPGPGFYTGSNSELCVIGVRGSMPPQVKLSGQVIETVVSKYPLVDTVVNEFPYGRSGEPVPPVAPKPQIDTLYQSTNFGVETFKHPHVYGTDGKIIHSRKPDIFRQRIDAMYPASIFGQGLGLFEREAQGDGWDVFGNQVEGSIPGPDFKQMKLAI